MIKFVGKLTIRLRNDYLENKIKSGELSRKQIENEHILSMKPLSNSKLYFWQIGYIISPDKLHHLISNFYENVFNDHEEWFKNVFVELGDKDHHIQRQYLFWMDIFYGHSKYRGGEKAVMFHHKLAKEIMTKNGAQRWMKHMNDAITCSNLNEDDPRIENALREFLNFTMETYGIQFDFNVIDWIHKIASL
jgi:truncated hemoglobin YjbI